MKLLVSLILSFTLFACSILKVEQTDLYKEYVKQTQAVKNNTIVANRKLFFTSEYLKEVDLTDEKSLLPLKLSKYIHQVSSHYQKLEGQKGCLSVNGIEINEDPVTIYVEYKKEQDLWLVDYMFLHLVENYEDYAKEALCPREVESMIFK